MIKYIDEFRDRKVVNNIIDKIKAYSLKKKINIMEICGGHTLTILKFGLKELLPDFINLVSGPGCPVCVTGQEYIDAAINLLKNPDIIITCFGDMMRVPGAHSNLLKEKADGRDIRVCLSPADAIIIAKNNPDKEIVFLGIGFETTAPVIASAIQIARDSGLSNFSVLSALKTMPEVMTALVMDKEINIDAFICPGHVSIITGTDMYKPIAELYRKPCVITGFEPTDMIQAIATITHQAANNMTQVENQYTRAVRDQGNHVAQQKIIDVFEKSDQSWRGLGTIKNSGLFIREKYGKYDAYKKYNIKLSKSQENPACICGEILRSIKTPMDCKLFAKSCTPENPVGACMVSHEGTCGIYYNHGLKNKSLNHREKQE